MCSLHSFIFAVLPLYIIGERHSTSVVTYDVFAAARTSEIPIERLCLYVQRVLKRWVWGGTKVNVKKRIWQLVVGDYLGTWLIGSSIISSLHAKPLALSCYPRFH